nr:ATP-binding protein [Allonocardiopsis opalescens]
MAHIRAVLDGPVTGPLMITGAAGMGHTTMLARTYELLDHKHDLVARIAPCGPAPFSALRSAFPAGLCDSGSLYDMEREVALAIAGHAGGRRLVVLVDDAPLVDQASLMTLRHLSRFGDAVVVICRPDTAVPGRPDPTDAFGYEPGLRTLRLPALSLGEVSTILAEVVGGPVAPATAEALYEVTGGSPRSLRRLVEHGLPDRMAPHEGVWRIAEPEPDHGDGIDAAAPMAADAARRAWERLDLDGTEELCRLALWYGQAEQIASVWPYVLLLRGRAADGIAFLDALPSASAEGAAPAALARAMCLAFGLRRVSAAAAMLRNAAIDGEGAPNRLLAYRAWLMAVGGRPDKAAAALIEVDRTDRETALFVHATRAAAEMADGRPGDAVFQLRRALAQADECCASVPWLAPYLTASLIDALLLASRIGEATSTARGFHNGARGCGWEIAFALSAMMTQDALRPVRSVLADVEAA